MAAPIQGQPGAAGPVQGKPQGGGMQQELQQAKQMIDDILVPLMKAMSEPEGTDSNRSETFSKHEDYTGNLSTAELVSLIGTPGNPKLPPPSEADASMNATIIEEFDGTSPQGSKVGTVSANQPPATGASGGSGEKGFISKDSIGTDEGAKKWIGGTCYTLLLLRVTLDLFKAEEIARQAEVEADIKATQMKPGFVNMMSEAIMDEAQAEADKLYTQMYGAIAKAAVAAASIIMAVVEPIVSKIEAKLEGLASSAVNKVKEIGSEALDGVKAAGSQAKAEFSSSNTSMEDRDKIVDQEVNSGMDRDTIVSNDRNIDPNNFNREYDANVYNNDLAMKKDYATQCAAVDNMSDTQKEEGISNFKNPDGTTEGNWNQKCNNYEKELATDQKEIDRQSATIDKEQAKIDKADAKISHEKEMIAKSGDDSLDKAHHENELAKAETDKTTAEAKKAEAQEAKTAAQEKMVEDRKQYNTLHALGSNDADRSAYNGSLDKQAKAHEPGLQQVKEWQGSDQHQAQINEQKAGVEKPGDDAPEIEKKAYEQKMANIDKEDQKQIDKMESEKQTSLAKRENEIDKKIAEHAQDIKMKKAQLDNPQMKSQNEQRISQTNQKILAGTEKMMDSAIDAAVAGKQAELTLKAGKARALIAVLQEVLKQVHEAGDKAKEAQRKQSDQINNTLSFFENYLKSRGQVATFAGRMSASAG